MGCSSTLDLSIKHEVKAHTVDPVDLAFNNMCVANEAFIRRFPNGLNVQAKTRYKHYNIWLLPGAAEEQQWDFNGQYIFCNLGEIGKITLTLLDTTEIVIEAEMIELFSENFVKIKVENITTTNLCGKALVFGENWPTV
jgi:hypothetical protein